MTDRDLLTRCGRALWGQRWQGEMAKALGIAERAVRHWLAGERDVPAGVWHDLAEMATDKAHELVNISDQILDRSARNER